MFDGIADTDASTPVPAGAKVIDLSAFTVTPKNARQFKYMVQYGMSPAQALKAATSNAADLIGRKDVGSVQTGEFADLVAVRGDPLQDVRTMEHVAWVMKGGIVYKDATNEQSAN